MAGFWDGVTKGVGFLVSNADRLAVGYGSLLQRKASISLQKTQANAQLAALKAQQADANAQVAIANAAAASARANPTISGANLQVQKSPLMMFGGIAIALGLAFVAIRASAS